MNDKDTADDADLESRSHQPTDGALGQWWEERDRLESETRPEQDIIALEKPGHHDVDLEAGASAHRPLEDVVCLSGDVSAGNQDESVKNDSVKADNEVGEERDLSHKQSRLDHSTR